MKFRLAALVALCVSATSATARAEEWHWRKPSPLEITTHVIAEGVLLADMLQTFDIKNHRSYRESNILLGEQPGDLKILGYFAGMAATTTLIWYLTPQGARYMVDGCILYFELPIVVNNRREWGLTMRLPF